VRKVLLCVFLIVCLGLSTRTAFAGILIDHGAVWPAPGGTSYTGTGGIADSGGLTYAYSGFKPSEYNNLYWGMGNNWGTMGAAMDGNIDSSSEYFTYQPSNSTNTMTWTGSTNFHWVDEPALTEKDSIVSTKLTATFTGSGMVICDDTTLSLGSPQANVGALWPVLGDYGVNLLVTAEDPAAPGTWLPMNYLFNLRHGGAGGVHTATSFGGGFYYTEPVPEPSTLALLSTGAMGLMGWAWRRRKT